ncbi:hypothetical protein A3Q56_01221 [Intoshia linei]|uniref:Tyrosine-protein kinase n=1 Tax=Intoshia linei TaxID=1819745 RepID=A0A177B9X9_9BILA|nr:hypothetical protein A3Q56_01221 [Intoshia linei]
MGECFSLYYKKKTCDSNFDNSYIVKNTKNDLNFEKENSRGSYSKTDRRCMPAQISNSINSNYSAQFASNAFKNSFCKRNRIKNSYGSDINSRNSFMINANSNHKESCQPTYIAQDFDRVNNESHMYNGNKDVIIVRALYDYQARHDEDLSFRKGDIMEIVGDTENCDWWYARRLNSLNSLCGFIPSNYVKKHDDNPESQEWWFNVDRREADKFLLQPTCSRGTFLVRLSSDNRSWVLSVLDEDETRISTRHYRIRRMENGGCYISSRKTFPSLNHLIKYYSNNSDGLCSRLTICCTQSPDPLPFKDIEVDRKLITLQTKLGEGNFGEVWSGFWRDSVKVAVKMMKQGGSMTSQAFLHEAAIMHKLRHRNLVQLMGVCSIVEPLYIIQELMPHGSLLAYLRDEKRGRNLSLTQMIDIAAQVANGMSYLEERNYVHRDLRAANILIGDNLVAKVADFGLARLMNKVLENGQTDDDVYIANETTKFPIKWTAPEAALERRFSVKSDVWSFGILIYEIMTFGRIPYPGMSGAETLAKIENGYRMPNPSSDETEFPESLYEIVIKTWDRNAEVRPTFSFLHSFLDDYFICTEANYRESI